jgi:hypothetical protein
MGRSSCLLSAVPPPRLLPILRPELIAVFKIFQRRPLEFKGNKGGAKRRFGGNGDGQQQCG